MCSDYKHVGWNTAIIQNYIVWKSYVFLEAKELQSLKTKQPEAVNWSILFFSLWDVTTIKIPHKEIKF